MIRIAISDGIYSKIIAVSVGIQKMYHNFGLISVNSFTFHVYDTVGSIYLQSFTCLNNATFVIV